MEISKKKYKNQEVKDILNQCISEYEDRLANQRDVIIELKNENKKLSDELYEFNKNSERTLAVLHSAEEKAKEIEEKTLLKYDAEVLSLKNFSERWKSYFSYLLERYPLDPVISSAEEIKNYLSSISDGKYLKDNINKIENKLTDNHIDNRVFNPKAKIQDYIVATSDSGFNMNEVLNPGKLELEDLCKELGLIEEI